MSQFPLPSRVLCAALFTLIAWAVNPHTTRAQLPDYLPTEGLVAWWPFNGNANDESGNGNDGVVNGATLTEDRDGNPNAAYYFSGSGCSTRIDANLNTTSINGELTLSIWVLRVASGCIGPRYFEAWPGSNSVSHLQLAWDNSSNYPDGVTHRVAVNQNGNGVGPTGLTTSSFSEVDDNTWTHIVYVNDGDNAYLWQDGVLRSTGSNPPGSAVQLASNIAIGRMNHPAYDALNGKIDDIAIYNRALTSEEVTALYTGEPVVTDCLDPEACNYEAVDEACVYPEPNLDCDGNCLNDTDGDGVCDENEVGGCTDPEACNYDTQATELDDSCTYPAEPYLDCAGNCLNDTNNNGICDELDVPGCTFEGACNYNPAATVNDNTCFFATAVYDCNGNCQQDSDGDGICDQNEGQNGSEFCGPNTLWDPVLQQCIGFDDCPSDLDGNGGTDSNDLLLFLAGYGNTCN